jgi:sugar O-acyltransferase (sialic acid O-acetyltransferase NeuD family)
VKNLYLIGGGGHCKSVIDVVESTGEYEIKGIFDLKENVGKKVLDYSIIGSDDDLLKYISPDNFFLITIGQIKSNDKRISYFNLLKKHQAIFARVVSPFAVVSKYASIEEGSVVMHGCLVNADARIGKNCIINSKALIEHDVVVGDHCHISTAAILNGNVQVMESCFVGSNAVIEQGKIISAGRMISAGSFYRGEK